MAVDGCTLLSLLLLLLLLLLPLPFLSYSFWAQVAQAAAAAAAVVCVVQAIKTVLESAYTYYFRLHIYLHNGLHLTCHTERVSEKERECESE